MAINDDELTGFLNNKDINQRGKIFLSLLSEDSKLSLILFEYKELKEFSNDSDFPDLIDEIYDFYLTNIKYNNYLIIKNNLDYMIEYYRDKQEYEKCSNICKLIEKL